MDIRIAGEHAVIIYFGDDIGPETLARVQAAAAIIPARCEGVIDVIPSYSSLVVLFQPTNFRFRRLRREIVDLLSSAPRPKKRSANRVTLPVYYSEESGPDLAAIARRSGLDTGEVIRRHSGRDYLVYAIGFAPGFAYLGSVDPAINSPRLATPRLSVPRGSVAIADSQTAVYPAASPGGWNLVGRCPVTLFDPAANSATLFAVGDTVIFEPVTRREYLNMGGEL